MKFLLFSAPWCEICHAVLPEIRDTALRSSCELEVVRVDTKRGNELRAKYSVGALPTLVILSNELAIASFIGSPIPKMLNEFLARRNLL